MQYFDLNVAASILLLTYVACRLRDFNQNIQHINALIAVLPLWPKCACARDVHEWRERAPVVMRRLETTGKRKHHISGETQLAATSPCSHPEETARTRQQCRQTNSISFLWRRKSVEYSHTQSLWIDVNTLKQRPVNTPCSFWVHHLCCGNGVCE